jgi:hypothetical protein
MLTTTHNDTGGHKTTLHTGKSSKTQMWWTCADNGRRNEANSKTAGCRFDSCPTCPRRLNSWELLPYHPGVVCVLCPVFDPNVIPPSTSPQVDKYGQIGERFPDTHDPSRSCLAASNRAPPLFIPGQKRGFRLVPCRKILPQPTH